MSEIPQPADDVGYGRPPRSTRFKKGRSGNPRGRPRNRRREVPHDTVLGRMVTIREGGVERRVTAAEAFILQLTKKGLEGCSASARASLASIEQARATRDRSDAASTPVKIEIQTFGICCVVEELGMAVRINRYSEGSARLLLKPWIVEAALARIEPDQLTPDEQSIVMASTRTPERVRWPEWWRECP